MLGLAESCFLDGKYNDKILSYLCVFYNGPTKKMAALWTIAKHFGIPVEELAERILIQLLYSSEYIEKFSTATKMLTEKILYAWHIYLSLHMCMWHMEVLCRKMFFRS